MSTDIKKMIESIVSGNPIEAALNISSHIKTATQAIVAERKSLNKAEAIKLDTSFSADECEKTGKWCVVGDTTGFEYDKVATEKAADRIIDDLTKQAKAKGRHVKQVAEAAKSWSVVENAGHEREKVVKKGLASHSEAVKWMEKTYDKDEIKDMHVDIAYEDADGDLSYDY